MTTAQVDDQAALDEGSALTGRLFEALIGSLELATVHLGHRLGLYDALRVPGTVADVAAASGVEERYAQEWLEQQAIAGFISVAEVGDSATRRYVLSDGQALALAEPESPVYGGMLAGMTIGLADLMPRLLAVYRTGEGITFGEFGDEIRDGQGLFNRAAFLEALPNEWLPLLPDVTALLSRPDARALDLGCGVGWSSIALAQHLPDLSVLGVDSDDASIMDARANADQAGLSERVRFEVVDAAAETTASYDVAFIFEALHDMAHPVEVLRAARKVLRPGGLVVVMDERAEEEFTPNAGEIERALAGFSVLHCLPVGRSEPGSAATGTVFRPSTMYRYAEQAGFSSCVIAPIQHDLFRFYVLTP